MNQKLIYIWLTKLKISNKIKLKILKETGGIKELFTSSLDDLVYFGFNDSIISRILDLNLRNNLEKDYEYMIKNNIDIIGIYDKLYPIKLKFIEDMPIAFYIRGNKDILDNDAIRDSRFKECIKRKFRIYQKNFL